MTKRMPVLGAVWYVPVAVRPRFVPSGVSPAVLVASHMPTEHSSGIAND
jgi:hypothetical protein